MTPSAPPRHTRRDFLTTAATTVLAAAGCRRATSAQTRTGSARLQARPGGGLTGTLASGPLGLGTAGRDGIVQMPTTQRAAAAPLLLWLHGAGQSGAGSLRRIGPAADAAGVIVVAPDSRGRTWDAIRGDFGEDVEFVNRTLAHVFARAAVDPARMAIGGFSDGATYALSLGLANGDLFPHVIGCSPGFIAQAPQQGRPRVFISHGRADEVLPIDRCSRVIVPRLESMRYNVTYREFDGVHELPVAIATEAMTWVLS